MLKRGYNGVQVIRLQRLLSKRGYEVEDHGYFDEETESALKLYQKDMGFAADGVAGPIIMFSLENPSEYRRLTYNNGQWFK